METYFEQAAEWLKERTGKFTASEIYKLMQKGRAKSAYFGETANSYIKSRLAEVLTQESVTNLDGLNAIEWGNSNEIDAVMSFEKQTKKKVEYFGKGNPMFVPYPKLPDWAGGSPDGFVGEDAGIEVKAPYNSTHHITHLLIGSAEDLKEEKPEYYGQIQFNMMCTGRKKWYFVSYDPRVVDYKLRLQVIEVYYDEAYCTELDERLHEAVKMLRTLHASVCPDAYDDEPSELEKQLSASLKAI